MVDVAYTSGGGTAMYLTSPLQRRLRDIRALTRHFAVKGDTFILAGAVLAELLGHGEREGQPRPGALRGVDPAQRPLDGALQEGSSTTCTASSSAARGVRSGSSA